MLISHARSHVNIPKSQCLYSGPVYSILKHLEGQRWDGGKGMRWERTNIRNKTWGGDDACHHPKPLRTDKFRPKGSLIHTCFQSSSRRSSGPPASPERCVSRSPKNTQNPPVSSTSLAAWRCIGAVDAATTRPITAPTRVTRLSTRQWVDFSFFLFCFYPVFFSFLLFSTLLCWCLSPVTLSWTETNRPSYVTRSSVLHPTLLQWDTLWLQLDKKSIWSSHAQLLNLAIITSTFFFYTSAETLQRKTKDVLFYFMYSTALCAHL